MAGLVEGEAGETGIELPVFPAGPELAMVIPLLEAGLTLITRCQLPKLKRKR